VEATFRLNRNIGEQSGIRKVSRTAARNFIPPIKLSVVSLYDIGSPVLADTLGLSDPSGLFFKLGTPEL
jgi:hypothetical protein